MDTVLTPSIQQITSNMTRRLRGICDRGDSIELIIPPQTRYISQGSFAHCRGLVSVEFPESLEIIRDGSFASCSSLKTVKFHANSRLVEIGEDGFQSCNKLEEIDIPSSLIKIGNCAFYGCTSLQTIHCNSTQIGILFGIQDGQTDLRRRWNTAFLGGNRNLVAACKSIVTTPTGDHFEVTFRIPLFGDKLVFDPVKQVKDQYPDSFGDESFTLHAQSTDGDDLPLACHSERNPLDSTQLNPNEEAIKTEHKLVDIYHGKIDFDTILVIYNNEYEVPESSVCQIS